MIRETCEYNYCFTTASVCKVAAMFTCNAPFHQCRQCTHTHTHTHRLGVFQVPPWKDEDPPDFDPCLTLRLFVQYVENLLCITMEIEKDHSLIQHAAASFYEVVSKSVSRWVTGNMISICVQ